MTPLPSGQPERRSGASTEALANSDRLARLIKVVSIMLALYVAVAVTIASVIGVVNSISANEHAAEAERLAGEAKDQAKENEGISKNVEKLVEQQAPCLEGDPPTSPACVRKAASDKIVADAIADIKQSLAADLDTHDLNAKASHDQILKQRSSTTPTARTPITSLPRKTTTNTSTARTTTTPTSSVAPTATRATPPPPTTTTTCPKRGKSDRCR